MLAKTYELYLCILNKNKKCTVHEFILIFEKVDVNIF